jgi:hypothetical protein
LLEIFRVERGFRVLWGVLSGKAELSCDPEIPIVKKEPIMNALRIIANKVSFPLPDMAPRGK